MTDRVEIYKPTGNNPTWVPGEGIPVGSYELVWRGRARVQPNLDWRARDREHGGELNATQAVRIQIPIGENELGDDVLIAKDYVVHVLGSEADAAPWLTEYDFIVRNALQASQKWLYNILCDAGTKVVG